MAIDPRMERQMLKNKYNSARYNLLAVVIFTAINIIMAAFGTGGYFLFSATIPYVITITGLVLCGMMPEEFYEGLDGMYFLNESFFYITLAISALILVLYLLCFFFSKKRTLWVKIALGMFIIDSAFMLLYYGIALDMLFDVLFHVWVIWILVSGLKAEKKLRSLPPEETVIEVDYTDVSGEESRKEDYYSDDYSEDYSDSHGENDSSDDYGKDDYSDDYGKEPDRIDAPKDSSDEEDSPKTNGPLDI